MNHPNNDVLVVEMQIGNRILKAQEKLKHVESEEYLQKLVGTIGADLIYKG